MKAMGVLLMKMAVLLKGNASCVWTAMDLAAIFYLKIAHWSILLRGNEGHGGDIDENGCFT